MADLRTQRATREQIAAAVGNNPRLIKLIESLTNDVTETLPSTIQDQGASGELFSAASPFQRSGNEAAMLRQEVELLRQEVHDLRTRLASAIQRIETASSSALTLTIGV